MLLDDGGESMPAPWCEEAYSIWSSDISEVLIDVPILKFLSLFRIDRTFTLSYRDESYSTMPSSEKVNLPAVNI